MPPRRFYATTVNHLFWYTIPAIAAFFYFSPDKSEHERTREIEHKYHDKVARARKNNQQIFQLMREQNLPERQQQFDALLKKGKGQPKRHYGLDEQRAGGADDAAAKKQAFKDLK